MAKRLPKPEDITKINFLSNVVINPKENIFAFEVTRMNLKKDKYEKSIYISNFSGKIKRLTSGTSDSNPVWSPDGKYLAFVSKRDEESKKSQLYIIGEFGEAEKVYEVEGKIVKYQWFSDSKSLLIWTEKRERSKDKDDVHSIDKIPIWFNGAGFVYDVKPHIVQIKIGSAKVKELKLPEKTLKLRDFSLSPCDKYVAYSVVENELDPTVCTLYIYDMEKERFEKIEKKPPSGIYNLSWSQNGEYLAFLSNDRTHGINTNYHVHILDMKNMKVKDLFVKSKFKYNVFNVLNSDARVGSNLKLIWDEGRIYFVSTMEYKAEIFSVDLKGRIEQVTKFDGSIDSFDIKNGKIVLVYQDFVNFPEIYYVKKEKSKKITKFNSRLTKTLILNKPEHLKVKNGNVKIDAWVLKPYNNKRKYPAILEIHGGPKTAYGNSMMFEFHLLAANGYAVIFSNPRGSDGYGDDFADIRGKYGKEDYSDIMKVIEAVLKKYKGIKSDQLGVTGGSYGGYMTNWIVTQTDIFKAAVSQRSISNWISMYGTTDIGFYFVPDQIGDDKHFWENFEAYWEASPLKYVEKVKTPLMLIHSMEDYRCWVPEALQFYTALKVRGVKTKLILFPNENHELSRSGKPKHRIRRYKEIINWFDENLKK